MIDVDAIRQRFSAVASFLDERGRRVVAAAEASAAGYGEIAAVSVAAGIAASTIGRGLRELSEPRGLDRVRRAGGGRKTNVAKDATLLSDLGALVEPTARGDPQSPLLWTCKIWWIKRSTRRAPAGAGASGARSSGGPHAGRRVARWHGLQPAPGLQGNRKTREGDSHPDRDAQFQHINAAVNTALAEHEPVISGRRRLRPRSIPRRRNWLAT